MTQGLVIEQLLVGGLGVDCSHMAAADNVDIWEFLLWSFDENSALCVKRYKFVCSVGFAPLTWLNREGRKTKVTPKLVPLSISVLAVVTDKAQTVIYESPSPGGRIRKSGILPNKSPEHNFYVAFKSIKNGVIFRIPLFGSPFGGR